MTRRLTTAALLGTLLVSAAACAGGADRPPRAVTVETTTTTRPEPVERPSETVDELVVIDHGQLHLRCAGRGDQTVLLLAGWDHDGGSWSAVEPSLAARTRVCSYDRFGTGTSDSPSTDQTFETQATDLHALLDAAGEPGPYVLIGHSFGGAEAVTFASLYPDETAGLVLVDASPATWPDVVCSVPAYEGGCAVMRDPTLDAERLDVFPAFAAVAEVTSLGDLPMTVMTAAHRTDPTLRPEELARLDTAWDVGMQRWASLSSAAAVVTVEHTGHDIQLDQPHLVIEEVAALLG